MSRLAQTERQLLCRALDRIGPDAPTLCAGWTTRDLVIHLIVRESRPDVLAGKIASPLAQHAEVVEANLAQRPFGELVETVRKGPPAWTPTRLGFVDEMVNRAEFFVHHEDVRRAREDFEPRRLSDDEQRLLWQTLRLMAKPLLRKAQLGITLVTPKNGGHRVQLPRAIGSVVLTGEPAELLLFAFGRSEQSSVKVRGDKAAVNALLSSSLGF